MVGEMLFGFLRGLARIRVTVAYAVILTGVTTALAMLGPRVQGRVISHASTNLHNLSHGRVGTLFISAFVIDAGPIYVWLPGLMCVLAVAELLWRSRRLVVAFAVGHIGATLLVAIGLTAAVEIGWLSSDVSRATPLTGAVWPTRVRVSTFCCLTASASSSTAFSPAGVKRACPK